MSERSERILIKRKPKGERHGLLLCDKPKGISSATLVDEVSRGLGRVRCGHAGTLDPMATGLMLVCVGDGTKLATFLVGEDKEYEGEATLGVTTTTLDADGQVVDQVDAGGVTAGAARAALDGLVGAQLQVPPMYSALKRDGRPLYELARQGIEVEREAREIVIRELAMTGFTPLGREHVRATVLFRVRCTKGTYVRSLAAQLGERLGVGAHLSALRRTRVGPFSIDEAIPGEGLRARLAGGDVPILSMVESLRGVRRVAVGPEDARRVRDGKQLVAADLDPSLAGLPPGERIAVVTAEPGQDAHLIAVAELMLPGTLRPLRGFSSPKLE